MEDIKFRDVKKPEMLKAKDIDAEGMIVLGRDQGAGVGTDLDGAAWPTQLHVFHDIERDMTIVLPKGPKNKIVPYMLGGIIKPLDVRAHFLAEFGPKPADDDAEQAIASEASEIVNSAPAPADLSADADDDE